MSFYHSAWGFLVKRYDQEMALTRPRVGHRIRPENLRKSSNFDSLRIAERSGWFKPGFYNPEGTVGSYPNSSLRRISMSRLDVRNGAVSLYGSVWIALVLALMAPQKAEAQVLYGSIVGNVKDASGLA